MQHDKDLMTHHWKQAEEFATHAAASCLLLPPAQPVLVSCSAVGTVRDNFHVPNPSGVNYCKAFFSWGGAHGFEVPMQHVLLMQPVHAPGHPQQHLKDHILKEPQAAAGFHHIIPLLVIDTITDPAETGCHADSLLSCC